MSNLKLPNLSYNNLKALVGERYNKTIAYATTATEYDGVIEVSHHGNRIATISPDGVELTTAGWNSQTTAARLSAILRDNLPNSRYGVAIRDGGTCLINKDKPKERLYFRTVEISKDSVIKPL